MNSTSSGEIYSPAAERNAQAVLAVLKAHLPARGSVLEVASGSGQHAATFARALPAIEWIPSDPSAEARRSIASWTSGAANVSAPLAIDAVAPETWPQQIFEAVVCINMIHISPWSATEGLLDGVARVLGDNGGLLALYGPYRESGVDLAPSNLVFDQSLKARNSEWGLRDRDTVVAEAKARHLHLTRRIEMPANNIMLLFRHARPIPSSHDDTGGQRR